MCCFFFQAEDGIRDIGVTGVQTCALPISAIGVIANQPKSQAGTLDIEASRKAAKFVQCCDAFGLPLLTLVDCGGFRPGRDLEWRGVVTPAGAAVPAHATAPPPPPCAVLRQGHRGAPTAPRPLWP